MSVEVKGLSVNINAPQGISASIKRFKKLDVNVGAVTITTPGYTPPTYEGETEVTPDKSTQTLNTDGYFVKDDITIHPIPDEYIVPEGTKNIVTNGEHDVKAFEKVDVDVPIPDDYVKLPKLSNEGTSADLVAGKELIDSKGNVVEGVIPTKSPSDISVSGATVTVLPGLYDEQVTKSVATATQATPSITVSSGGLITAKATQSAGYVSSGTKQATKQLTTQAAKTVTPTKSSQTAVASGRYTTGAVTVAPIPDQYIVPSGEKEITEKGKYDVTEYASVNVDIEGGIPEDLDSVLTEQEELIAELQDTLRGKAAGGGGIPEGYYDASGITTSTSDVRKGKEFINQDGRKVGTMTEYSNEEIDHILNVKGYPQNMDNIYYPIPNGYHDYSGYVSIEPEAKTATPTKSAQDITPTDGKVLYKVTVNPIPDEYIVPDWEYKQVTPTKEFQHVVPSEGKVLGAVGVDPIPDEYIIPQGEKEITENGQYDVSSFASVNINVAGGGGEPDPRDQYQRVEYIESAEEGTYPYIITDFCADNDSGVEVVASYPILQDRIPMGSREDSNSTRFYCCYPLSSTGSYYGFNSGLTLSGSFAVNTKYICQTNFLCSRMAGIFTPNGDRKSSGIITSTLTTQSGPVSIFGYRYCSTGNMASKREYKFYGARLSQLFEVVREYIPCYRKSDGVVGVYEKFTGQFLTNDADTGSFAKGADIDW